MTSAKTTTELLTILAEPPGGPEPAGDEGGEGKPKGRVGALRTDDDGNIAIETIWARLQQASKACPGGHVLTRASTVRGVATAAARAAGKSQRRFEILQIVGHGMPGQVSLGFYWNGVYFEGENYYALDSNPHAYGVLRSLVELTGVTQVRLIGCKVGSSEPSGLATNGPTLLFSLGQLWKDSPTPVTVLASDDLVSADNFDETTGSFTGRLVSLADADKTAGRPVGYNGRARAVALRPHPIGVAGGASKGVAVTGRRAYRPAGPAGPAGPAAAEAQSAASSVQRVAPPDLMHAFDREVLIMKPTLPLATPLCSLTVECEGQPAEAELLFLDTYYVRTSLARAGALRYFALNPAVSKARVAAFLAEAPTGDEPMVGAPRGEAPAACEWANGELFRRLFERRRVARGAERRRQVGRRAYSRASLTRPRSSSKAPS